MAVVDYSLTGMLRHFLQVRFISALEVLSLWNAILDGASR